MPKEPGKEQPIDDLAAQVVEAYKSGERVIDIAQRLDLRISQVQHIRRKANVPVRRKTDADVAYFDGITSEAQTYWLGFLYADGNVHRDQLKLHLSSRDIDHLEKFRDAIGSTNAIRGRGSRVSFAISSKELVRSLGRAGIHPAKAHTCRPPLLPQRLERHYWRGVFDGDGWFSILPNRTCSTTKVLMGLAGNRHTLEGFRSFLHRNGVQSALSMTRRNRGSGKTFQLAIGRKRDIQTCIDLLWADSTVWLTRKFVELQLTLPHLIDRPRGHDEKGRFVYLAEGDEGVTATPPPADAKFSARLRFARRSAGLTQNDLALAIGVRNTTVWAWESAGRMPLPRHAAALVDLLGDTVHLDSETIIAYGERQSRKAKIARQRSLVRLLPRETAKRR